MTIEQKAQIKQLRQMNQGYATIAARLGLSVSSVKGYCQRSGLAGNRTALSATSGKKATDCLGCGKPLQQKTGVKTRKFCSPLCRQSWWNAHPENVKRRALYSFTCPVCGEPFTAYGNANRKYCSHQCYITDRYRGGVRNEARAV